MKKMYIGGDFVEGVSKRTFPIENPATEETLDDVPRAGDEDANRAVAAAVEAQKNWSFTPAIERCQQLHEAARRLREHLQEIATLMTLEGGKPLIENMDEVE